MTAGVRAELLRLRKWPAFWVILGVWILLDLMFVYVFNYLSYRNGSGFSTEGVPRDRLLAGILPSAVPTTLVEGSPMFGGAIMLTLGALVAGGGYAWGTWKTAFTQGPSRVAATAGTLAALGLATVGVVVATFAVNLATSVVLATVEGQGIAWPDAGETVVAVGAAVLILGMWTLAGAAVGTLARGPALAVGLGVVWILAVENLLRGAAALLDWLRPVTDVLPGSAAGSIAAAVGASPVSEPGGTPGVVTVLSGGPATVAALVYVVVFVAVTVAVVRRRDIA